MINSDFMSNKKVRRKSIKTVAFFIETPVKL